MSTPRTPKPDSRPPSAGPANRYAPTAVERQRAQLDRLLKDPANQHLYPVHRRKRPFDQHARWWRMSKGAVLELVVVSFTCIKLVDDESMRGSSCWMRLLRRSVIIQCTYSCFSRPDLITLRKPMLLSLKGRERMPRSKLMPKLRRTGPRGRRERKGWRAKDRWGEIGWRIEGQRVVDVYRTHLSEEKNSEREGTGVSETWGRQWGWRGSWYVKSTGGIARWGWRRELPCGGGSKGHGWTKIHDSWRWLSG